MGIKTVTVFVEEGGQPERWLEGQHTVMLSRPLFQALSDTEAPGDHCCGGNAKL
ncbi:MAG: hypothetical protein ACLVJQ_04575 [Lentihominibacter sp.]